MLRIKKALVFVNSPKKTETTMQPVSIPESLASTSKGSGARTRKGSGVRTRKGSEVQTRMGSEVQTRKGSEVQTRKGSEVQTRKGSEVQTRKNDVIFYRNARELGERLVFLVSAKKAGNNGVENEINAILDELLRIRVLTKKRYDSLYREVFS